MCGFIYQGEAPVEGWSRVSPKEALAVQPQLWMLRKMLIAFEAALLYIISEFTLLPQNSFWRVVAFLVALFAEKQVIARHAFCEFS